MAILVKNEGSTARDFCMLERNFLAHIKLGVLLALLAFSILLHTRLMEEEEPDVDQNQPKARIAMASLQIAGALASIAAGYYGYHSGSKDLLAMRAFLGNEKPQLTIVTAISGIVLVTCIVVFVSDVALV
ncbi:hypothetical protein BDV98DRAFT_566469 [Pterulicium gracile]|uniref:DUF202 domain-containing protein n=1 Tax=Pterulicium gracile TaxID=1884261 RepID=A0A5C3QIV8_9AGAR|nr:hypothetical protein BDV98DRAFT_566469 [Pterula gracilis]